MTVLLTALELTQVVATFASSHQACAIEFVIDVVSNVFEVVAYSEVSIAFLNVVSPLASVLVCDLIDNDCLNSKTFEHITGPPASVSLLLVSLCQDSVPMHQAISKVALINGPITVSQIAEPVHMVVLPVAQILSLIAPKHLTVAMFDWILGVAPDLTTVKTIVFFWVSKLTHEDQVWIIDLPLNYVVTLVNILLGQYLASPSL